MQPKTAEQRQAQSELFRSSLEQILNPAHPLMHLSKQMDWHVFEETCGKLYAPGFGRPGLPTRLMVGLHYLKEAYGKSDESVLQGFLENPYWQYFCGMAHFVHELPLDPTSLSRWRKRMGTENLELLLKETVTLAQRGGHLRKADVQRVVVDSTVQEKAIRYPTDARLYHRSIERLGKAAKAQGIKLRQSYVRVSKKALIKQGRYAHAKQYKRAQRECRKLRTYLGRMLRDIERKAPKREKPLDKLIETCTAIYHQQRHDTNKVYSVHAPEVECISKGKAEKRYEFGCKMSVSMSAQNNWVLAARAYHGNPYDGHTLRDALEQTEQTTKERIKCVIVDQGYRLKVKDRLNDIEVYLTDRSTWSKASRSLRKWLKRRAAIEPVIGHIKHDNGKGRNWLAGALGDKNQAILSAAGFNFRKLLRAFLRLFCFRYGACLGGLSIANASEAF